MTQLRARTIVSVGLGVFLLAALLLTNVAHAATTLEEAFRTPPDAARPWVYWFWLSGNITEQGITADLEAMKRVGIGGVLIMEVDQGAPTGPVDFMGTQWRALFKHAVNEAARLGIEVNMNDDAGWNGSGGPWIKPSESMQKVVFTELDIEGPKPLAADLKQPETVADYYKDIAVLAFPTPTPFRMEVSVKAGYQVGAAGSSGITELPQGAAIDRKQIVDISDKMDAAGKLNWEVPAGKWTIVRFGHTSTGVNNAPAPLSGRGLECDKLSKAGIEANFNGMMKPLIADVGTAAGKTLVATHIDSWENGSQNWTAAMRDEFKTRRGYDMLSFLPAYTGRILDSLDVTERFLWDLRQTTAELVTENYAGHMRELAHQHGLKLSIEAYGGPTDDLPYAGQADEPMCEFWIGGGAMQTCKEMASAVHIYGKPILGAEAFTAGSAEKWLEHPASIKALGDVAFCDGVNRFVFHRYAMQPWLDRKPGMTMGPWGLHYERTNTWWDWSSDWHAYLSRCQLMLRQGQFVADLCYLQPEDAPQNLAEHANPGYDYDNCSADALLTRMSVKDGKLVLPDGMGYRALVLPRVGYMTPRLLQKVRELIDAGATVIGAPPQKSPSLTSYPDGDAKVAATAAEIWGSTEIPEGLVERTVGKGRVFWGNALGGKLRTPPDAKALLGDAKWIWFAEGKPAHAAPVDDRFFRRTFAIDAGKKIASAELIMTADNEFRAWLNGKPAGKGDHFKRVKPVDVAKLLKPGDNILAVTATNGATAPNPAGLVGMFRVTFEDGSKLEVATDMQWTAAKTTKGKWKTDEAASESWHPAMELGALGMGPWGLPETPQPEVYPEAAAIADVLNRMSVPRDFSSDTELRYIHRRAGDTDIYFVANGRDAWCAANCTFRVTGKQPELWNPLTGRIEPQRIYREVDGRTTLPLWLEPSGSIFVVFRKSADKSDTIVALTRDGQSLLPDSKQTAAPAVELHSGTIMARTPGRFEIKTAAGGEQRVDVALPASQTVEGGWKVRFDRAAGGPESIAMDKLISWSESADNGVKYYSGQATYSRQLTIAPELLAKGQRLFLDLGRVQVMAAVKLNGKDLGILWRTPYSADITDAAKPGDNALEITVVNLWPNRMIGDEQLPEDSTRKPNGTLAEWPQWLAEDKPSPTGRYTFTSWRLWSKADKPQESGLLGPVTLQPVAVVELKP